MNEASDRFGLGWRRPLAAGIFANRARLDLIEVMAEDFFAASAAELSALETLGAQIPVVLHGVSLGLASAAPVDETKLAAMAAVAARVRPIGWSEHLAFVRAGGVEIGHLAAPPRTPATRAGTVRNVARATAVMGSRPWLENVATLLIPPGSVEDEVTWVKATLVETGCDLLLDLHNLYANAVNFGLDPHAVLHALPADRIAAVHIAGGRYLGAGSGRRLLDDHLHDVPPVVFDLLTDLGAIALRPLTVVLERDGSYPPISDLLQQLDVARAALQAGRRRPSVNGRTT